jgi:hypothetical protein
MAGFSKRLQKFSQLFSTFAHGAPAQLLVGLGQYAARASPSSRHASPRSAFSPEPSGLFGHRVVVRTAIQGTGLPSSCMHILSLSFFFVHRPLLSNCFVEVYTASPLLSQARHLQAEKGYLPKW